MQTQILFFASLKEQLDCTALELDITETTTVAQLRAALSERGSAWQKAFANPGLLCAVNQDIASDEKAIKNGDEIAFFPPVTGG